MPMFMPLHILVGDHDVVGWWLELIYTNTPPTHYQVESSEREAYMETHPNSGTSYLFPLTIFHKVRAFLHHQVDICNLKDKNLQNVMIIFLEFCGPPN
jgi:hypothetical protein